MSPRGWFSEPNVSSHVHQALNLHQLQCDNMTVVYSRFHLQESNSHLCWEIFSEGAMQGLVLSLLCTQRLFYEVKWIELQKEKDSKLQAYAGFLCDNASTTGVMLKHKIKNTLCTYHISRLMSGSLQLYYAEVSDTLQWQVCTYWYFGVHLCCLHFTAYG